MAVYDITETDLSLHRIVDPGGTIMGYALGPLGTPYRSQAIAAVDPQVDLVEQVQVHLFASRGEAEAFAEGLILAGEPDGQFNPARCAGGWAVVRALHYPPDDPDDPTVRVITYHDKPRALVLIGTGVRQVLADPEVETCVVDYDAEPGVKVPARFRDLLP